MLDIGDELPAIGVDLASGFVAGFAREIGMDWGRFTNHEEARAQGLPGQIAPGNLSLALITRCLLQWAPKARIKRVGTTFRAPVVADQRVVVRGNVVGKHESDDDTHVLECDVWIENTEGERLVVGTATLEVASRA